VTASTRQLAAIVPAWLVEAYEEILDREDGRIATERLAEIRAGHPTLFRPMR
jgi:hypothetical protein